MLWSRKHWASFGLTVRRPKDTVPTNLVTVIGHAIMLDGTLMRKVSIHNVTPDTRCTQCDARSDAGEDGS